MNIEINEKCAGGYLYWYASSLDIPDLRNDNISLDKFKEILELRKIGICVVYLYAYNKYYIRYYVYCE